MLNLNVYLHLTYYASIYRSFVNFDLSICQFLDLHTKFHFCSITSFSHFYSDALICRMQVFWYVQKVLARELCIFYSSDNHLVPKIQISFRCIHFYHSEALDKDTSYSLTNAQYNCFAKFIENFCFNAIFTNPNTPFA